MALPSCNHQRPWLLGSRLQTTTRRHAQDCSLPAFCCPRILPQTAQVQPPPPPSLTLGQPAPEHPQDADRRWTPSPPIPLRFHSTRVHMSHPAAATGSGGAKRPAEVPTAVMDAAAIQRPRLGSIGVDTATVAAAAAASSTSSSSASSSSSFSSSLSPAQRCAADAVATIFSFLPFKELPVALRVCRPWHAAASQMKARAEPLEIPHGDRVVVELVSSGSPLTRHIGSLRADKVSLATLRNLALLPSLTILELSTDAVELEQLLNQRGRQQARDVLRSAFPPRLRELSLIVSWSHSRAACQLLLDALPTALEQLELSNPGYTPDGASSVSLKPLLRLPGLSRLRWHIAELSAWQLQTIKHMAALRRFRCSAGKWTLERLSVFCRPPHRLQRLETMWLWATVLGAEEMAELLHMPGLKKLHPRSFRPDAFAFLPRLPLLEDLHLHLPTDLPDDLRHEQHSAMDASLRACANLTRLTLHAVHPDSGEPYVLSEELGARLVQCMPRLRQLRLSRVTVSSLHFLSLAPDLSVLELNTCSGVRSSHVMALPGCAPRLESLVLHDCFGLRLDQHERHQLTPPTARLRQLHYRPVDNIDINE